MKEDYAAISRCIKEIRVVKERMENNADMIEEMLAGYPDWDLERLEMLEEELKERQERETGKMENWRKPTIEAAEYRHIVAIIYVQHDEFEDPVKEIKLLTFDDIGNEWVDSQGHASIKLKDILWWVPMPKLPEEVG